MSDRIFFESDNLLVTNTRFHVDNETYIIRNITSVQVHIIPGKKGTPGVIIDAKTYLIFKTIACIVFMVIGTMMLISMSSNFIFFMGAFLIGIGLLWIVDNKIPESVPSIPDEPDTYELILKTAGGEIKAFATQDKMLIDNLAKALNEAFDYGG